MPRATPKLNNLTQKKGAGRGKPTDKDLADALVACKGILVAAVGWLAKERGKSITRQTLAKRIDASERLRAVVAEVEDQTLDWAESRLLELINRGDKTAILFYLKCKGKARGYTERQEVAGVPDSPLALPTINVEYVNSPDDGREVKVKGIDANGR